MSDDSDNSSTTQPPTGDDEDHTEASQDEPEGNENGRHPADESDGQAQEVAGQVQEAARRRTRTRTRTRTGPASGSSADPPSNRDGSAEPPGADGAVEAPSEHEAAAADTGAPPAEEADGSAAGEPAQRIRRRRRGRRGGRGRGSRGRSSRPSDTDSADAGQAGRGEGEPSDAPTADADTRDAGSGDTDAGETDTGQADTSDGDPAPSDTDATTGAESPDTPREEGPTRLQSKRQQNRNRARGRGGGRRPAGAVSDETRWAINESPPKRMLISAGKNRTQVAVLEQRTLVEHFVARKEDESIVGNIYLGRVQNVLPGMEAAFVDIGQGRNGVLYAGEVDYPTDTDDIEQDGELPRIEKTLKAGQTVLVQVTKDAMGSKGARLTQHLSLAGRFCVLAPGGGMLGISRKLPDEERKRLRSILADLVPEGFGVILRTAAEGATREQLEADVVRLTRIWEEVSQKAASAKPLTPVYEEPSLVMRVVRDVLGPEYEELVIDEPQLADHVRDYLSDVAPDLAGRVSVHADDQPIFDAYEVTVQVRRALEKKVWLPSGGYLIVEKTEAMWIIDVNTGKFVGEDNLEETVLRNNLEAAEEIARQLRLRDMGGIIVIDFVDMLVPANRDEVLKRFKRELARDKTKTRVMDISRLGLVQMTRKNVSHGLTETFTTTCEHCEGRGAVIVDVFD